MRDVIEHLTKHGCEDLTKTLDESSASPVSAGGLGDVYRGSLRDKRLVAIKALRVSFDSDDEPDRLPKRAARELYAWSQCNHFNVLPLLGLVQFEGQIRMVSLWMENGSLPEYLNQHPDTDRCNMSVQVANGLSYIHGTDIIHGDLKGQNVLVSEKGVPMITDFGNAVLQRGNLQFTETRKAAQFTPRWTASYFAPELLVSETVTLSKEGDVYALGMEIITGTVPYSDWTNEMSLIFAIGARNETPKRPEAHILKGSAHGDKLWSLLIKCWSSKPKRRPKSSEVAQKASVYLHFWFIRRTYDLNLNQMAEIAREGLMGVHDSV
ncbi:hypothetical protein FRC12_008182 [Ceratobasidium sp. 428]|nr:hypothetical protein FRC12_008182 [Ceratobasidium sp. 428]